MIGQPIDQRVVAQPAEHGVQPRAAIEIVVADTAIEQVVARPAQQRVVALAPGQGVIALAAVEHVVAAVAIERVVAGAAQDAVIAVAAKDEVVARPRIDLVIARAGMDHVVAGAAGDPIIAIAAAQDVRGVVAGDRLVRVAGTVADADAKAEIDGHCASPKGRGVRVFGNDKGSRPTGIGRVPAIGAAPYDATAFVKSCDTTAHPPGSAAFRPLGAPAARSSLFPRTARPPIDRTLPMTIFLRFVHRAAIGRASNLLD